MTTFSHLTEVSFVGKSSRERSVAQATGLLEAQKANKYGLGVG